MSQGFGLKYGIQLICLVTLNSMRIFSDTYYVPILCLPQTKSSSSTHTCIYTCIVVVIAPM